MHDADLQRYGPGVMVKVGEIVVIGLEKRQSEEGRGLKDVEAKVPK